MKLVDEGDDWLITFLLAVAYCRAVLSPPQNVRLRVSVSHTCDINTRTFTHRCVRARFRINDVWRYCQSKN